MPPAFKFMLYFKSNSAQGLVFDNFLKLFKLHMQLYCPFIHLICNDFSYYKYVMTLCWSAQPQINFAEIMSLSYHP